MAKPKARKGRSKGEVEGKAGLPELATEQPTVTVTPIVYFATAAMSALLAGRPNLDPRVLAAESFRIAEAMLNAARLRDLM